MSSTSTKRVAHKKSRKGCGQCKRRRVKCDEIRPKCSGCERLDLQCDFGHAKGSGSPPSTAGISPPNQPIAPGLWTTTDMQLLHHYMNCSCVGLAADSHRARVWATQVPEIAFQNAYLLHQLLAVAALHVMTDSQSESGLLSIAARHRELALEGVAPVMADWTPGSSVSLFAFAGLAAIYSYAEVSLQASPSVKEDVLRSLTSCLRLSQGISTILKAHSEEIQAAWTSEMLKFNAEPLISQLRDSGLNFRQLDNLEDLIRSRIDRADFVSVYLVAARRCLDTIALLLRDEDLEDEISYLIMSWPNEIDELLIEQLERKEPVAMVIIAHFAVLMSMQSKYWWFRTMPGLILRELERCLPVELIPYLTWPKQMLNKTTTPDPEIVRPTTWGLRTEEIIAG